MPRLMLTRSTQLFPLLLVLLYGPRVSASGPTCCRTIGSRGVNAALAVTLVAALFAVMHFNPSETPALFVAGCAFGAAAAGGGRGALAAATTAHAVYNAGVLAETALDGAG